VSSYLAIRFAIDFSPGHYYCTIIIVIVDRRRHIKVLADATLLSKFS